MKYNLYPNQTYSLLAIMVRRRNKTEVKKKGRIIHPVFFYCLNDFA